MSSFFKGFISESVTNLWSSVIIFFHINSGTTVRPDVTGGILGIHNHPTSRSATEDRHAACLCVAWQENHGIQPGGA